MKFDKKIVKRINKSLNRERFNREVCKQIDSFQSERLRKAAIEIKGISLQQDLEGDFLIGFYFLFFFSFSNRNILYFNAGFIDLIKVF